MGSRYTQLSLLPILSHSRAYPLPSIRYCAGTMPWGHPGEHHDFEPQRHDDGYLEVIGFTMTSLVSGPLPSAHEHSQPYFCQWPGYSCPHLTGVA